MIDYVIALMLILVNVSAVLNMLLILYIFFDANMNLTPKRLCFSGSIFFVINLIMAVIPGSDSYTVLVVLLYMIAVVCILSQSHRIKNSVLIIPAALMYVQWGSMFGVIERLVGMGNLTYNYKGKEKISVFFFLSDIVLIMVLLYLFRKLDREKLSMRFSRVESVIIIIICIIYPIMVQFFVYMEQVVENPLYRPFWLISMILINFAVVFAMVHRKKTAYYRQQAAQYKEQFQAEYTFFNDYRKRNQSTIKFRHDINNHMLVLKEMLQAGEYERASAYFAKLADMSGKSYMTYITGNEILDMILNAKQELLKEHNIRVVIDGTMSGLGYMNDVDCCILFSNLIDNAVEANILCEKNRFINITSKKSKNMLYFTITNPFTGQEEKRKQDGKPHGIGLRNVSDIISKYEGEYRVEYKDGVFRVICCIRME